MLIRIIQHFVNYTIQDGGGCRRFSGRGMNLPICVLLDNSTRILVMYFHVVGVADQWPNVGSLSTTSLGM